MFPTATLYAIASTLLPPNHTTNHTGNSTLKWLSNWEEKETMNLVVEDKNHNKSITWLSSESQGSSEAYTVHWIDMQIPSETEHTSEMLTH